MIEKRNFLTFKKSHTLINIVMLVQRYNNWRGLRN